MFKNHNHLGFNNPFYFKTASGFHIEESFEKICTSYINELSIDPVAIVEHLNRNYFLGDRNAVNEIKKTPWLAKPNHDLTEWIFEDKPQHGELTAEPEKLAKKFFTLICDEIFEYVKDSKTVGILLSGGMDSRMVAGALDYLMKNNKIDVKVTGLTWGNEDSRDVNYAREITKRLNWNWKHYLVKAEDLLHNVIETGINGCEYSPIHLHAIPHIRDDNELDVILAGSYGDSVGRAEYGGVHVTNLTALNKGFLNVGNLINPEIYHNSILEVQKDLDDYHSLFPSNENYIKNELDYQLHYMRRQLNPCMALLNNKSDFHQVFTHPNTFRFMWSLDTSVRNDELYKYMITFFQTDMSDIPWARTGLRYGETTGKTDRLNKRHHSYVEILNFEILEELKDYALSPEIKDLHIFNYDSLEELFILTKKYPLNSFYYTEKLAWIASLAILVDKYNAKGFNLPSKTTVDNRKLTRQEYKPKYYRNKVGGILRTLKIIK